MSETSKEIEIPAGTLTVEECVALRAYFERLSRMYAAGVEAFDSGDFSEFIKIAATGEDDTANVLLTIKLSMGLDKVRKSRK